ncbi:MAG TPA: hypothetical protein VN363_10220 [Anaerolineales bacterium]|nr:hypothetical protein [Anaerolineales bacterium]
MVNAQAVTLVDADEVASEMGEYLQAAPQIAKYFQVRLDAQGQPVKDDILAAARSRVSVRILLNPN